MNIEKELKEQELKLQFEAKYRIAANLEAYQAQLANRSRCTAVRLYARAGQLESVRCRRAFYH